MGKVDNGRGWMGPTQIPQRASKEEGLSLQAAVCRGLFVGRDARQECGRARGGRPFRAGGGPAPG
eukprot:5488015-Lingulodinium_polyedra.AAC.1